jgi:hypothetical protein
VTKFDPRRIGLTWHPLSHKPRQWSVVIVASLDNPGDKEFEYGYMIATTDDLDYLRETNIRANTMQYALINEPKRIEYMNNLIDDILELKSLCAIEGKDPATFNRYSNLLYENAAKLIKLSEWALHARQSLEYASKKDELFMSGMDLLRSFPE